MQNHDPIAVVSMGCIFPQAYSPKELWDLCLKGKNIFTDLSKDRWNIDHHYSKNRNDLDKTYSKLAAEIPFQKFQELLQSSPLPDSSTRLEVYLYHSLMQVFENLTLNHDSQKIGFILGLMNPDEEYNHGLAQKKIPSIFKKIKSLNLDALQKESVKKVENVCKQLRVDQWENSDRFLSSEVLQRICETFSIHGPRFIVDAACASSLSSIDIGINLLRNNIIDTAIVGGAESNLSPGMYAVFSQVGALAEFHSLPFDKKTEGLIQGEGAGLFALQRLETALSNDNSILTVIVGSDGSSDGKTSSLFQPNPKGQEISYSRVHQRLKKEIAHMEAHGTGTQTGDKVESVSVADYFNNQSIPMSSIKSLIGHTKGAAGAAGLIKSIFLMKEKKIPKTHYIEDALKVSDNIFYCQEEIKIDDISQSKLFGVSGFGFGGTNYHIAVADPETYLSTYKSDSTFHKSSITESVIIGEYEKSFEDFDPHWFMSPESPYRLPPQSLSRIDKAQLLAVQVTYEAIKDAQLPLSLLPTKDILTISASILGLDLCSELAARLQVSALQARISEKPLDINNQDVKIVNGLLEVIKDDFQACSEDHAPGLLNNVIAGRVCQAFNLNGRSYNIESGFKSKETALFLADLEVRSERTPMALVIYLIEEASPDLDKPIQRKSIGCKIVSSEKFCKEFFVKPKSRIHINA